VSVFARAIESNHTNSATSQTVTNNESGENASEDKKESDKESEEEDDDDDDFISEDGNSENTTKDSNHLQSSSFLSDYLTTHSSSSSSSIHHQFKVPISAMQETFKLLAAQKNSSIDTKGSWSPTETHLFILALEVCGKNFSAIKKEYLPWKSVKSMIEFYYLNKESINRSSVKKLEENSLDSNSLNETKLTCTSTSSFVPKIESTEIDKFIEKPVSDEEEEEDKNLSHLDGLEVKPLKAKPLMDSIEPDSENRANISNLGSLKFYMDGHLVLKLNAQKETSALKCQWVESSDTPNIIRNLRSSKNNSKLFSLSSERSECDPKHIHNDKCQHQTNDEIDDYSFDSSDDDSLASSESNYLISGNVNYKKAKVRVEDCYVPLPSPFNVSAATTTVTKDSIINNTKGLIKQEGGLGMMKKEQINSFPTSKQTVSNKFLTENQSKKKNLKMPIWLSDRRKSPLLNLSENNRWYSDKPSSQPPVAHASSRLSTTSTASSSSSFSTISSMNNSNSNLISAPVDLTRKSVSYSPPKSSLALDCQKSKSISSSSPPNAISPANKKMNKSQFSPATQNKHEKGK